MRLIDLDDNSHCFTGNCGDYENWNIDPDISTVEAVPVDFITNFIDTLMLHRVFGNEEEKIASYYGINVLESLLDSYYDEVTKNEQHHPSIRN